MQEQVESRLWNDQQQMSMSHWSQCLWLERTLLQPSKLYSVWLIHQDLISSWIPIYSWPLCSLQVWEPCQKYSNGQIIPFLQHKLLSTELCQSETWLLHMWVGLDQCLQPLLTHCPLLWWLWQFPLSPSRWCQMWWFMTFKRTPHVCRETFNNDYHCHVWAGVWAWQTYRPQVAVGSRQLQE